MAQARVQAASKTARVSPVTHGELVREILKTISQSEDCRAWINNTGAYKSGQRLIRFGLVGSSDIIGILRNGIFLAIEVKVGRDSQSDQQKNFEAMICRFGGVYILARNVGDAIEGIDRALKGERV